jgi:hypothetical protein
MHAAYVPQEHEDTVPPEPGFTRGGGEPLVLLPSGILTEISADFRPQAV